MARNLIPQSQINSIRAEMRKVTDQFHDTPIKYYTHDSRPDREGNKPVGLGTEYTLMAMVEYPTDLKDLGVETESGIIPSNSVKVTLNIDYLIEQGLADENGVTVFEEGDFMDINGKRYRVRFPGYDGPLERKNVLAIIIGEVREV